jgi:cytosine deaminase
MVVFPQEGIFKSPGTAELMWEALNKYDIAAVGGIPYNDPDHRQHTDFIFALAKEFDLDLDLHVDFSDNQEDRTVEYIAERTIAEGYRGRVAVDHLTSIGSIPADEAAKMIAKMAEAQIHIVTLPSTDLYLGGRQDTVAVRRGLTRVKESLAAGINVVVGSNNIRNAFTPFGLADPIQIALFLANTAHMGTAQEQRQVLDMCTYGAAKMMKLKAYGLKPGCSADLVVLDTKDAAEVLIDLPLRKMVIKSGIIVVQKQVNVQVHHTVLHTGI